MEQTAKSFQEATRVLDGLCSLSASEQEWVLSTLAGAFAEDQRRLDALLGAIYEGVLIARERAAGLPSGETSGSATVVFPKLFDLEKYLTRRFRRVKDRMRKKVAKG